MAITAQVTISGQITFAGGLGEPLMGVPVYISGTVNDVVLTDESGRYNISVPSGGSYSVHPFADANPLNGVTTYDAVLVNRHLTGEELFTNPYRFIAADVDASNSVELIDSVNMRKLILGIDEEFPCHESWRFIPASYVFPDPLHPFPYPKSIEYNNLSANVLDADFLGVKLGDINSSALVPVTPSVSYWLLEDSDFARVTGFLKRDENDNCLNDDSETSLAGWKILATGSAGTFFDNTNLLGGYTLRLPPGNFTITAIAPNELWSVCTPPQNLTVELHDSIGLPFTAQAETLCPRLAVDLVGDHFRRCFNGFYYVLYHNSGTITAEDAYVELQLDPYLSYSLSSIPGTPGPNNTYTFQLGDIAAGAQGDFLIQVGVSCDAELGQTHCSTAHIYPDSLCGTVNQAWNGANLRVSGLCNGDNVEFTVTNDGADMDQSTEYVIIEDIMIQMDALSIQLAHDESQSFTVPANGSTWRLEVDQPADHPWSLRASAAVEGCGTNEQGLVSHGIIALFAQDDAAIFEDEECTENTGSYDPNDKQGFPKGVGPNHFIPKGEEIEYVIRFQNTGTDTAFTVLVMDTLSTLFDILSIRPGASSSPYTFNLLGQGVAQFVFSNIMLPDSNVNEAASHGFVKFTISPKADLPDETQLENQAGIYFDFNEPVITNRTLHTIGEDYLEVTNVVNLQPDIALNVFPNPARTEATFRLQTDRALNGTLFVYDLQGREVKRFDFSQNTFKVNIAGLPSGHYVFRVDAGGEGVSTGKIMVEK